MKLPFNVHHFFDFSMHLLDVIDKHNCVGCVECAKKYISCCGFHMVNFRLTRCLFYLFFFIRAISEKWCVCVCLCACGQTKNLMNFNEFCAPIYYSILFLSWAKRTPHTTQHLLQSTVYILYANA